MADQAELTAIAENYLATLINGDGNGLVDGVGAGTTIDDPHCGRIEGPERISEFAAAFNAWLAGVELRAQHLRTTASAQRVCSEGILHIRNDAKYIQLPVGTVVSNGADGVRIHVYYTQWPFHERHSVRPALFSEPESDAEHTGVVLKYFQCLNSGNLERLVTCFEADIYFREASGPPWVHWGTDAVRTYFMGLFNKGAPMLRDDTVLDDGRCAVMEFSVIGWNGVKRDPKDWEAGLAVYERSGEGLMRAIRIYDDVDF